MNMKLTIALAMASLILACGGTSYRSTKVSTLQNYTVKSLVFNADVSEGSGQNEIEVHIVDADTNESILCSGVDNGMQVVQESGTVYDDLDANFIRTDGSTQGTVRGFYVTVLERDSEQCPGAPDFEHDTTLARSDNIDIDDFATGSLTLNNHESGHITLAEMSPAPQEIAVSDLLKLIAREFEVYNINTGDSQEPRVEVHIVDVDKNESLVCMGGAAMGLETIETANTTYTDLYAAPILVTGISEDDSASRLRIVALARADMANCPEPFEIGIDRIQTTSQITSGEDLLSRDGITFESDTGHIKFVDYDAFWEDAPAISLQDVLDLIVDGIKFIGNDYEVSAPEIEVHISDPTTDEEIACAGADYSMSDVTTAGRAYSNLNVDLAQIWDSAEPPHGFLRVAIVDRDSGGCPTSADPFVDDYLDEAVVSYQGITDENITMGNGGYVKFK
jgi:hypothetical protein